MYKGKNVLSHIFMKVILRMVKIGSQNPIFSKPTVPLSPSAEAAYAGAQVHAWTRDRLTSCNALYHYFEFSINDKTARRIKFSCVVVVAQKAESWW